MNQAHNPHSLTLFLMTEKGYAFLQFISSRYKSAIKLVVVGSDKSIKDDYELEIINFCNENKIPFIKKESFQKIESEYVFAISWRWLIKHPMDKLIVFHDSLLPKYRGFAPLINALINGEQEIGVSAILGANHFDTGAIIAQSKTHIKYPLKISAAIKINNANYLKCAEIVLTKIFSGKLLDGRPQNEMEASYSIWRDEDDYKIDWSRPAAEICRFIDAVGSPYKGAMTLLEGKIVRVISAQEAPTANIETMHFGKVIFLTEGKPTVICGKGMLMITEANIELDGQTTPLLPLKKLRVRFGN